MRRPLILSHGIAILIGLLASSIVYWQTTRVTPLIDYSYQVENAYRIAQGAVPYRDFFLVVAPGTYVVMAFVMKVTGGYSHMANVYLTMIVAFSTILITYNICILLGMDSVMAVSLLIPLVFTGQSIYPYPLYDPFVALAILISIYILFFVRKKYPYSRLGYIIAGMVSVIPILFKQNTGGLYVVTFVFIFSLSVFFEKRRQLFQLFIAYLFGVLLMCSFIYFWLITQGALSQYIYQTFTFPSVAKNPLDAIGIIISQLVSYGQHVWSYKFFIIYSSVFFLCIGVISRIRKWATVLVGGSVVVLLAYLYITVPPLILHDEFVLFFWVTVTILSLMSCVLALIHRNIKDDALLQLLPVVLIGSSFATFLSHGIVHSSYHMWPFAILMVGSITSAFKKLTFGFVQWWIIVRVLLIFLMIILARSVADDYAMDYVSHSGISQTVDNGKLKGLSTPGAWMSEFENMMQYVKETIPKEARVAFLPGEDPFFTVSERTNPLRFSLLHSGVYTLEASVIIQELLDSNVEWIVVKVRHQTYPQLWITNWQEISYWMQKYYRRSVVVGNYEVYKKIVP